MLGADLTRVPEISLCGVTVPLLLVRGATTMNKRRAEFNRSGRASAVRPIGALKGGDGILPGVDIVIPGRWPAGKGLVREIASAEPEKQGEARAQQQDAHRVLHRTGRRGAARPGKWLFSAPAPTDGLHSGDAPADILCNRGVIDPSRTPVME